MKRPGISENRDVEMRSDVYRERDLEALED